MRFFTRCRVFQKILIAVDVILGIVIAFQIPNVPEAIQLKGSIYDRTLLLFALLSITFITILLIIIVLKCIIRDADEDLNALMHLHDKKNISKSD